VPKGTRQALSWDVPADREVAWELITEGGAINFYAGFQFPPPPDTFPHRAEVGAGGKTRNASEEPAKFCLCFDNPPSWRGSAVTVHYRLRTLM